MNRILPILVATWLCAAAASAQPHALSSRLTSKGRIMPSGDVGGFWSSSNGRGYGSYATWNLHVAPAATYFVRDQLGIGLRAHASWSRRGAAPYPQVSSRGLGGDAGLMWNAVLGERWSLLPQVWLGYAHVWEEAKRANGSLGASPLDSGNYIVVHEAQNQLHYLRATLVLHLLCALSDAIAIGFGPELSYDHLFGLRTTPGMLTPLELASTTTSQRNRAQVGGSVSVYASF